MLMRQVMMKPPNHQYDSIPVVTLALPRQDVKATSNSPAMMRMIQFMFKNFLQLQNYNAPGIQSETENLFIEVDGLSKFGRFPSGGKNFHHHLIDGERGEVFAWIDFAGEHGCEIGEEIGSFIG